MLPYQRAACSVQGWAASIASWSGASAWARVVGSDKELVCAHLYRDLSSKLESCTHSVLRTQTDSTKMGKFMLTKPADEPGAAW